MSYIAQICELLETKGIISHLDAWRVLNWVNPNDTWSSTDDEKEENSDNNEEISEENLQELLDDSVEMRQIARERKRHSGGGGHKTAQGCRAIKAPELNLLITERILRDQDKCLLMAMLASGNLKANLPDWSQWSQCIEKLYAMTDNGLKDQLKLMLNKAFTSYVLRDVIAKLMSLYDGSFFSKRHLDDVCGPSVTTFLMAMKDNFDLEFTAGSKNSWLYADAPNLVVMRHALIVRNRLRNPLIGILKALEVFLAPVLEIGCRLHQQMSWAEFQECKMSQDSFLHGFQAAKLDGQVLADIFTPPKEPMNLFAEKLILQWALILNDFEAREDNKQ